MHYLFGNAAVAEHSLQRNIDGELKLSQRMRLEQTQLDGVSRKMQVRNIKLFKKIIHTCKNNNCIIITLNSISFRLKMNVVC